jgi:hypothetical protein
LEMGTVHSVGSVWNWMEMDYCLEMDSWSVFLVWKWILDRFLFGNGFFDRFSLICALGSVVVVVVVPCHR